MPVRACDGSRDSIIQNLGRVLGNHFDYDDPNHIVTSYCRVTDGTWIAWRNIIQGDSITDTPLFSKTEWQSRISSTYAIGVGYFPDDETAPIVYELGLEPTYQWNGGKVYAGRDPCAWYPLIGDKYSDNFSAELDGWGSGLIDVQVRTDGTNVWVVALARESVEYPFIYNAPSEIDRCGNTHPGLSTDWSTSGNDAFSWDTATGNRFWLYTAGSPGGGDKPFGDYDDAGPGNSLRWQPARVSVFAGDIGGFTLIGHIDAKFANDSGTSGLCGPIEACASPAEPGVMHLLWAEAGWFGTQTVAADQKRGERINYSRWDFTGNLVDNDVAYVEQTGDATGHVSSDAWVWTGEYVLRNDHGSPVAIVWPPDTDGLTRFASGAAEFWDLSAGTVNVLQTADATLAPTLSEGNDGDTPDSVFPVAVISSSTQDQIRRGQYASSLYTDPTLDNTDVYLLCVGYGQADQRAGAHAFLRVPADGTSTFTYMDGTRLPNYSIIPGDSFDVFGTSYFSADFVSDTKNVWMPIHIDLHTGGGVLHLTRICERTWEVLPAFPDNGIPDSGYLTGDWGFEANVQPPALVTDAAGEDWIVGGGNGPVLTVLGTDPTNIAALRARICRCCVPCLERVGLHVWQVI